MSDNCCTPTHQHTAVSAPAGRDLLAGTPTVDVAECPVMTGRTVVKATAEAAGLVRDYDGNRYWLCCAGCGPAFDANPARYATA
ncbi:hypothetical protein [Plantibacter sp. 2H11-2]|uniref:hypothetical protein n=1 Tax=Plantibacter sp. 2H11-2 TaxID=3414431 RepID=UPI003CEB1E97